MAVVVAGAAPFFSWALVTPAHARNRTAAARRRPALVSKWDLARCDMLFLSAEPLTPSAASLADARARQNPKGR